MSAGAASILADWQPNDRHEYTDRAVSSLPWYKHAAISISTYPCDVFNDDDRVSWCCVCDGFGQWLVTGAATAKVRMLWMCSAVPMVQYWLFLVVSVGNEVCASPFAL
jgi:hypothetical protein